MQRAFWDFPRFIPTVRAYSMLFFILSHATQTKHHFFTFKSIWSINSPNTQRLAALFRSSIYFRLHHILYSCNQNKCNRMWDSHIHHNNHSVMANLHYTNRPAGTAKNLKLSIHRIYIDIDGQMCFVSADSSLDSRQNYSTQFFCIDSLPLHIR